MERKGPERGEITLQNHKSQHNGKKGRRRKREGLPFQKTGERSKVRTEEGNQPANFVIGARRGKGNAGAKIAPPPLDQTLFLETRR